MSKYYNNEIPSTIHFVYGGKNAGKTYHEFNKLKKEIQKLQEENEELKLENEKLTQLWLNSQEKRRKAIECIKQELKDKNIDIGLKAILELLLSILKGDSDE